MWTNFSTLAVGQLGGTLIVVAVTAAYASVMSGVHLEGRLLPIDQIPDDLFEDQSDSKQSETAIWPYLLMIFLLLLLVDVVARKLLNLNVATA